MKLPGSTQALSSNGSTAGDNAAMESFWALLQTNVLDRRRWRTRAELEATASRRTRSAATSLSARCSTPSRFPTILIESRTSSRVCGSSETASARQPR